MMALQAGPVAAVEARSFGRVTAERFAGKVAMGQGFRSSPVEVARTIGRLHLDLAEVGHNFERAWQVHYLSLVGHH